MEPYDLDDVEDDWPPLGSEFMEKGTFCTAYVSFDSICRSTRNSKMKL